MKKAQIGLDFMMTYGWAILLIVLIMGALFTMGIFDIGSFLGNHSSGFAQIKPVAWRLDSSGMLTVQFQNSAGTNVNITAVNATLGTNTISFGNSTLLLSGKKSDSLSLGTFPAAPPSGSSYSAQVQITYIDTATSFVYNDGGTLTGKAG
ncbi:Uncharacterised protein [uncultured archaeon]|nr:Uncharacterised protein [uncultured archaeon]